MLLEGIRRETGCIVSDLYKYFDTTVPRGVDEKAFTYLKYDTRNREEDFTKRHNVDKLLFEKVAIRGYMREHTEEEILSELDTYYTTQKKREEV